VIANFSRHAVLIVLALVLLAGCAHLTPELDPPTISVLSFKSLPSDAGAPRFEIKLRVLNPNKQTLDIAGISYSVAFLDRELITGVTNEVAPIAGYGEGVVTLDAHLQLLELVRLMTSLGSAGSRPLAYRFSAKIDFNGFLPTQHIEETGEIKLN
jgi:LEA14-like dessication related protein